MSIVNIDALKQMGCEMWWTGEMVSANTPKVVTTVGKVMQYPPPFEGAGVINLDGVADYLGFSTSDIDFSISAWTIEVWVFCTTYAEYIRLYVNGPNGNGYTYTYIGIQKTSGYAIIDLYNTSSIGRIISTMPVRINTWNHFVAQRNGSELFLALNGISCGTVTLSGTPFVSTTNVIGRNGDTTTQYLQGGMSEFRISNVARYTSSATAGTVCFVPPRYRFESDANTLLLLHFDEYNDPLVDSSSSPKTITNNGVVVSTETYKIGSDCGKFVAANSSYLSVPVSDDFVYPGDFTIETYVYLTGHTAYQCILSQIRDHYGILIEENNASKLCGYISTDDSTWNVNLQGVTTYSLNTWYHVVVQRSGNVAYLYLNGKLEAYRTMTAAPVTLTQPLNIGRYTNNSQYINGYLNEMRISKGIARYPTGTSVGTTYFTPPITTFVADAYTKLLIHFFSSITDDSPSPKAIVPYGLPIQMVPSLHNGVGYFTNNTTYLSIPDSADMELGTNNFTIRMKVMLKSLYVRNGLFNKRTTDYGPINIEVYSTNKIMLSLSSTGTSFNICNSLQGSTTFVADKWYDIELTRSGSTFRLFVDGNIELTVDSALALVDNSYAWLIGCTSPTAMYLNGCISEVVFINGYALHTANFTPPTTPFEPDSYTKLLLRMNDVGTSFYDSATRPGDNGFPIMPGVAIAPVGSFTSVKTKSGKYVLHKPAGTNYISIGNHTAWNINTTVPFAILFWIRCTTVGTILGRSCGSSDYANESYFITFNAGKLQLRLELNAVTPYDILLESTTILNDGVWRHVAIVFTGSSYNMYINHQLESTSVSSIGTVPQSCAFAIFCVYNVQTSTWASTGFVGEVADLMMFKGKIITQDQITAIMNETFIY